MVGIPYTETDMIAILTKFSSLVALKVAQMTNSNTACDENSVKRAFPFQRYSVNGKHVAGRLWRNASYLSMYFGSTLSEAFRQRHPAVISQLGAYRTDKNFLHMMTSSNGNISALLAICAENTPVTGEFPAQRPVTRSFDVFFDLRLSKRLSKQSWGWWLETLAHYDVTVIWNQSNESMAFCICLDGTVAV